MNKLVTIRVDGDPGTGKSLLLRMIEEELAARNIRFTRHVEDAHTIIVNSDDIIKNV